MGGSIASRGGRARSGCAPVSSSGRDLPLAGDASARFLPWVAGAMVFLAALALAGAMLAQTVAARWQHDLAGTVFSTGGCHSWYMDAHGVNRTLWSGMTWQYWLSTRQFHPAEYEFTA